MNYLSQTIPCFISSEGSASSTQVYANECPWHSPSDPMNQIVLKCRRGEEAFRIISTPFVSKISGSPPEWLDEHPFFSWTNPLRQIVQRTDVLEGHVRKILGSENESRLEEFKLYEKGWDSGKGESLSKESIAILNCFVNKLPDFGLTPPSLFLTRSGNLQLSWEDNSGSPIEVEFFPDRIEYYVARTEEEGSVEIDLENPIQGLEQIIQKIS